MTVRWRTVAVGVVSAGAGLAASEVVAGLLSGTPSLVASAGEMFVPALPSDLVKWAIRVFGTADKAVAQMSVVVAVLVAGAVVAWAARKPLVAGAIVALLAVAGLVAMLQRPESSVLGSLVIVAVTVGVAAAVMLALLRRFVPALESPADPIDADGPAEMRSVERPDRRAALITLAGVGAAAVVAAWVGRSMLRSGESANVEAVSLPQPSVEAAEVQPVNRFGDVEGLSPIVVPNDEFYRIDVNFQPLQIDHTDWRLRIHGLVEREVELTFAELTDMPTFESFVTLACVSNEVGGSLVGNARWRGVMLRDVLALAGPTDEAEQVMGVAADGWTAGFPIEAALDDRGAMIAVGMNGEPLPVAHGFPARLIVPGLFGYVSATKWLTEIELVTWDVDGYWIPRGWAKEGPILTQSRIDVPRQSITLDAGQTVVAGVAWAPLRGVAKVEISVDDGPWMECELSEPLSEAAWVQWKRPVDLAAGRHVISVRATDGTGAVQTAERTPVAPSGATGYHTIQVRVG